MLPIVGGARPRGGTAVVCTWWLRVFFLLLFLTISLQQLVSVPFSVLGFRKYRYEEEPLIFTSVASVEVIWMPPGPFMCRSFKPYPGVAIVC
jgi:hypothetical protein